MPSARRSHRRLDLQKIVDRRLALGLKQGEVARRANISQSLLSDIENDRRNGSPAVRKRLAEVLGFRRVSDIYAPKDEAA